MLESLLLALGLVLIIEGIFPFVAPENWRETFRKLSTFPARHIRLGGLVSIGLGLLLLMLLLLLRAA